MRSTRRSLLNANHPFSPGDLHIAGAKAAKGGTDNFKGQAKGEGRRCGPAEDEKPREHGKGISQSRAQTGGRRESISLRYPTVANPHPAFPRSCFHPEGRIQEEHTSGGRCVGRSTRIRARAQ